MFDLNTLSGFQVLFVCISVMSPFVADVMSSRHPEEWNDLMDKLYFIRVSLLAVIFCLTCFKGTRKWLKIMCVLLLDGFTEKDMMVVRKTIEKLESELEDMKKQMGKLSDTCVYHQKAHEQTLKLKDDGFAARDQEIVALKTKEAGSDEYRSYWRNQLCDVAKERNDLWERTWDAEGAYKAINHKIQNLKTKTEAELAEKDQLVKTTTENCQQVVKEAEATVSEVQKMNDGLKTENAGLKTENAGLETRLKNLALWYNLAVEKVEEQDQVIAASNEQDQIITASNDQQQELEEEKFGKIKKSLRISRKLTKKHAARSAELEDMVKALEKQKDDVVKAMEEQKEDVKRDLLFELARHQKGYVKQENAYKARIQKLQETNHKLKENLPTGPQGTDAAVVTGNSKEEDFDKMDVDEKTLQDVDDDDDDSEWMQIE